METTKKVGDYGEKVAEDYLIEKGYQILSRNYRTNSGEIDIIAQQRDYLVFVEVKTRKNNLYMSAREAVNYKKQQKIRNTAREYIRFSKPRYKYTRFDIIEYYTQDKLIEHFVDAF